MRLANTLARTGALIILLAVGVTAQAQDPGNEGATSPDHPVYFVLLHSPGPAWAEGVPFRE